MIIVTTNGYLGYNGKTCTATQGSTKVTAQFANNQARLEVPRAGKWDITTDVEGSSVTSTTFVGEQTVNVSVQCNAKLNLSIPANPSKAGATGFNAWCYTTGSSEEEASRLSASGATGYRYGNHCAGYYNSLIYSNGISVTFDLKEFGVWNWNCTYLRYGSDNVIENKTYSHTYVWRDTGFEPPEIFGDESLESPSIEDENSEKELSGYWVNTTSMSEEQFHEVEDGIHQMEKENKTYEEILEYITQMEEAYGQI